jgi:hypothetical protein
MPGVARAGVAQTVVIENLGSTTRKESLWSRWISDTALVEDLHD